MISLAVALSCAASAGAASPPSSFFGIVPQTAITGADTAVMRSGGIGSLRTSVDWGRVEAEPGQYDWSGLDSAVEATAKERIQVLPYLYSTPSRLSSRATDLPVANATQQAAWAAFLQAAVRRYGPGGTFWAEHGPGSGTPLPSVPIRTWQIWNEANFFYFATPASPRLYAKLLEASSKAIKAVDPRAKILLSGLFGEPKEKAPKAMLASAFLGQLYRVPGIKRYFDGVALHPYAAGISRMEKVVSGLRKVIVAHGDRRTGLYITELGWGSQNDPKVVAFEVGMAGQARILRRAYVYLISDRAELNLKGVYWFSWKDARGPQVPSPSTPALCSFCDSAGLFPVGDSFRPKPAWHAFVRVANGSVKARR
jgi:polysaccharide biosynthesis protein PslG